MNSADAEELRQISDRRHHLCRNHRDCPECRSEQVQLVDWFTSPARWKCRICKRRFEYEPFIPD